MDKDKLRRKMEQQTARDHTFARAWSRRRQARIERLMNEPFLPRYCLFVFWFMVIGTAAAVSIEAVSYLRGHLSAVRALSNTAQSGFFTWLLFSAFLLPGCIVQLRRGFGDPYFDRFRAPKSGKPAEPVQNRYIRQLVISASGLVIFGVLYLIFRSSM